MRSYELLHYIPVPVQQDQVGLVAKGKLLLVRRHVLVVDIQIDELNLSPVIDFQPVNHRRKAYADRSPEGEQFDHLGAAGAEHNCLRVGSLQFFAECRRRTQRNLCRYNSGSAVAVGSAIGAAVACATCSLSLAGASSLEIALQPLNASANKMSRRVNCL